MPPGAPGSKEAPCPFHNDEACGTADRTPSYYTAGASPLHRPAVMHDAENASKGLALMAVLPKPNQISTRSNNTEVQGALIRTPHRRRSNHVGGAEHDRGDMAAAGKGPDLDQGSGSADDTRAVDQKRAGMTKSRIDRARETCSAILGTYPAELFEEQARLEDGSTSKASAQWSGRRKAMPSEGKNGRAVTGRPDHKQYRDRPCQRIKPARQ